MARFTTFDGLSLHYEDAGEGLPLLCLSGLTRTGRDFDYLAPHLPDLRLIRMDYRGRGQSDHAPDPLDYTIANEARDALLLLDHLGLERAAILGTSRGGLIGMALAATAKDRLMGLALNDVGPEIGQAGLARISGYVGHNPKARTLAEVARAMPAHNPGFEGVPPERWLSEASHFYTETATGLKINYDPGLRQAFLAAFAAPPVPLWPLFDACTGLPLALVRGANSDLLTAETAAGMCHRRPDMIYADVPGRGHVPFLDEPESLAVIRAWLELMR